MSKKLGYGLILLFNILLIWGCSEKKAPVVDEAVVHQAAGSFHLFSDTAFEPVDDDGFVKKVDNFTIIFDPSASMTETYQPSYDCVACHFDYQNPEFSQNHATRYGGEAFSGKEKQPFAMDCSRCHTNPHYTKLDFARGLAQALNKSIPDLDLTGTIRTFGYPAYSTFAYGFLENDNTKYYMWDRKKYGEALEEIWQADGASPLAPTLRAVGRDWKDHDGKIAVIIITDGKDMDERVLFAARDLKYKYGDRVCIYTILIGNDSEGRALLERVSEAGQCGMSVNGDNLLNQTNMEGFIREVFLTPEEHDMSDGDSDGDGVPDCCDDCPETAPERSVGDNGCWNFVIMADVLFDFDQYELKPKGRVAMDQVLKMMNQYPSLNLHIAGHTDNYGSMEYNIDLSKHRAQTGKNYLVENGIDPGRITLSWHSYTMPVASNSTEEGRALNRRLEFKFNKGN